MIKVEKDGTKSVRVRIEGQVQKVGFRHWTLIQASQLNLEGWVRNRSEGWVEAVFIGPEARVNEMIKLCYKGPSMSRVTSVKSAPYRQGPNEPEIHSGYGFRTKDTL